MRTSPVLEIKILIQRCSGFYKAFTSFDAFESWCKIYLKISLTPFYMRWSSLNLSGNRNIVKASKSRDWPEYHIITKDKAPWEKFFNNEHCILSYFITSLGCTNLLRCCEKQWKCNWKSNTNIMAFNAFQNHLMQWYCKKYWALLESSILRPSLLFVFMISPVTYFVCRCGWMHYCETAEKLYLPLFVCPSIPHRWHLHLSEFYDILDHTDHTFSESSWHPLSFWPLTHHPLRPTGRSDLPNPPRTQTWPFMAFYIIHTNQIFSETSWHPHSSDSGCLLLQHTERALGGRNEPK